MIYKLYSFLLYMKRYLSDLTLLTYRLYQHKPAPSHCKDFTAQAVPLEKRNSLLALLIKINCNMTDLNFYNMFITINATKVILIPITNLALFTLCILSHMQEHLLFGNIRNYSDEYNQSGIFLIFHNICLPFQIPSEIRL